MATLLSPIIFHFHFASHHQSYNAALLGLPSTKALVLWQFTMGTTKRTRPKLERRKTLGHLRSINRNMVIHFANQSQTCQLLTFFFKHFMKKTVKWCNQSKVELMQKIHIDYQGHHIYIYNMSSSCYNISTISPSVLVWLEFTGWAIIEELSIRRRLCTFLISCVKTSVRHCYVVLSSRYELFLSQSNNFRNGFAGRFQLPGSTRRIFFIEIQGQEIILALMCLC